MFRRGVSGRRQSRYHGRGSPAAVVSLSAVAVAVVARPRGSPRRSATRPRRRSSGCAATCGCGRGDGQGLLLVALPRRRWGWMGPARAPLEPQAGSAGNVHRVPAPAPWRGNGGAGRAACTIRPALQPPLPGAAPARRALPATTGRRDLRSVPCYAVAVAPRCARRAEGSPLSCPPSPAWAARVAQAVRDGRAVRSADGGHALVGAPARVGVMPRYGLCVTGAAGGGRHRRSLLQHHRWWSRRCRPPTPRPRRQAAPPHAATPLRDVTTRRRRPCAAHSRLCRPCAPKRTGAQARCPV